VEDNVPEDMSLVLDTEKGCTDLRLRPCRIINTLEYAARRFARTVVHAALAASISSSRLRHARLDRREAPPHGAIKLLGAHCTGIEPVYQLRQRLARAAALLVGASDQGSRCAMARSGALAR